MELQSGLVRFSRGIAPAAPLATMRASRDDERWTSVPLLDSDDGAAAARRHARGRTGRWVAAGAAVGAIALVLVAALALTDPARRRGVAATRRLNPRRARERGARRDAGTNVVVGCER